MRPSESLLLAALLLSVVRQLVAFLVASVACHMVLPSKFEQWGLQPCEGGDCVGRMPGRMVVRMPSLVSALNQVQVLSL